jgi:hypothetical protein
MRMVWYSHGKRFTYGDYTNLKLTEDPYSARLNINALESRTMKLGLLIEI